VWLHFGKKQAVLEPGLHYVGRGRAMKCRVFLPGRVQRVQVGLRSVELATPRGRGGKCGRWCSGNARIANRARRLTSGTTSTREDSSFVPEEATTVVGDENFVAVTMVIHFVDKDPVHICSRRWTRRRW